MNQLYWLFFYFFQKTDYLFSIFGSIFLSLFLSLEHEAHVLQH